MTRGTKIIIILFSLIAVMVIGGLYLLESFLSAFAPPKVIVTKDYISTNRDFMNGVKIEKIIVDSMGADNYPLKYTVLYTTTCNIRQRANKAPIAPSKIEFYKPGEYSWNEDTIKGRYLQSPWSRQALDTTNGLWWLNKFGKHPVCPLKFERGEWYFITIADPKVTGIFFYIDSSGKEHQYFLESGVCPI